MPLKQIAKVLKANGTEGGLLIGFRGADPGQISLEEPVFVYFDGLPVPFFILSLTPRGTSKAIASLSGVTSLKDALELEGAAVWADIPDEEDDDDSPGMLVGWTLVGAGKIVSFVDIPANPCFEVETKSGSVVLVPFHEDLILSADPDRHELELDLPPGLLDL